MPSRCRLHRLEFSFRKIGQLNIFKEELEEFVLCERENEFIFALSVGRCVASLVVSSRRLPDSVSILVFAVAGHENVAFALPLIELKALLADVTAANGDTLFTSEVRASVMLNRFLYSFSHARLHAANESLAISQAVCFGVLPSVNDMHFATP